MIKHIVFFRFTEILTENERIENAKTLCSIFSSLKDLPSVNKYRVGININESDAAWDVVIDSTFESPVLLEEYNTSREHIEAIEKGRQFAKERSVIDYKF